MSGYCSIEGGAICITKENFEKFLKTKVGIDYYEKNGYDLWSFWIDGTDESHYVRDMYRSSDGSYWGEDDEKFLNGIAPFIEEGGYVDYFGNGVPLVRIYFHDGRYSEYVAHIEYPGCPVQD